PFEVISGYRSPATNNTLRNTRGGGVAKHSLHMVGKAIDVRLPGVPLTELRDAALSLRQGGVGFYPSAQFVHLDTGPVRRW
ncbi:MAG: YcbK family protein, partial [Burkholderiaceae bacterium]